MRRRAFITLLGGVAAVPVLAPLIAHAQKRERGRRIGVLIPTEETDSEYRLRFNAFLQSFQKLGWIQDQNFTLEIRYADNSRDRMSTSAAELVALKVDVILTAGTEAVQAAQKSTRAIPIVMATIGDPVGIGVAKSLARPGGNTTGLSLLATDLSAKRLELLKECIPTAQVAAIVWNPNNASVVLKYNETKEAAKVKGISLLSVEVRQADDLAPGLASVAHSGAEVVITADDPLLVSNRVALITQANRYRLPVMTEFTVFVAAGALMAYGPSALDLWRRSAAYVDRILKGTHPSDLPIEQPTKFDLAINMKSAKALNVTVPPILLGRADEVIE